MHDDETLDLAIDLFCSMQLESTLRLCQEVALRQGDDDPWFRLLDELARLLVGSGHVDAVLAAEQRVSARAASVLGEMTEDAPRLRRLRHAAASTMRRVQGRARVVQPTVLRGPGALVLGEGCQFGFVRSSGYASGVGYIESRHPEATISIGSRTILNNDFAIVSKSPGGISIGADCVVGVGVQILDFDGHGVAASRRHGSHTEAAPVDIGDNVWLGAGVLVQKGVTIGRDSVVAARAVVTRSVPPGTIVAGMPARPVGSVPP
jgi:maltose O-acetyltransferase